MEYRAFLVVRFSNRNLAMCAASVLTGNTISYGVATKQ